MSAAASKRQAAREVIDILTEVSLLLNTHLDRPTLSLCVSLIENGIDPEVLAVSRGSSGLAEKALTPNPSRRSSRS
ncbi:hypothetical protein XPA_007639 [Xanthoria parietina]